MYSFVETELFTRLVSEYLSDEEYRELQRTLIGDPEAGDVVPGSGGVRKLRWRASGRASAAGTALSTLPGLIEALSGC